MDRKEENKLRRRIWNLENLHDHLGFLASDLDLLREEVGLKMNECNKLRCKKDRTIIKRKLTRRIKKYKENLAILRSMRGVSNEQK